MLGAWAAAGATSVIPGPGPAPLPHLSNARLRPDLSSPPTAHPASVLAANGTERRSCPSVQAPFSLSESGFYPGGRVATGRNLSFPAAVRTKAPRRGVLGQELQASSLKELAPLVIAFLLSVSPAFPAEPECDGCHLINVRTRASAKNNQMDIRKPGPSQHTRLGTCFLLLPQSC